MPALTAPQLTLVAIMALALGAFLSSRVRPDLVALLVLLALALSGLVTPDEAMAGFARPSMIALAGLFVITAALARAGAIQWVGRWLEQLAGRSEWRLVSLVMAAGAAVSLTMNNVVAASLLLAPATEAGRRAGVPAPRLLMPLGYGILLGGMATVFTTANIIVNGQLHDMGLPILDMPDFLKVGGLFLVAGLAYMVLLGRHLLPLRMSAVRQTVGDPSLGETYGLQASMWELRLQEESPLCGQTVAACGLGARLGVSLLAIFRGQQALFHPEPGEPLERGDVLLVLGTEDRILDLENLGVAVGRSRAAPHELPVEMTEALVAPRSRLLGQTLAEVRFRDRFGLTVVGLWRGGRSRLTDLSRFRLQPGDALLVVGPPERLRNLGQTGDFIVPNVVPTQPTSPAQALTTLAVSVLVMAVAALGLVPMAQAMLGGGVLLVVLGCLTLDEAYQSVEWGVIVMVAAMAPLGNAMANTGLTLLLGDRLEELVAHGPLAFLLAVFVLTVLVTQVVGGQVAPLILGPLVLPMAMDLHGPGDFPGHVALALALGCSTAFLTPVAHPVNALMMAPAGYRTGDFLRVGGGLTLVCAGVLLAVAKLAWGL